MKNRKKITIILGIVFVLLFIVCHKFLAKIILNYQQHPAIETQEAYQIITQYQQPVLDFYTQYKRCPQMADKKTIIPTVTAYHYVKTIRFLEDDAQQTCFITAVMRDDTPSKSVKRHLITIAYEKNKPQKLWSCYTDIESPYTVAPCLNHPLPKPFLQASQKYEQLIKD